eukprot:5085111-Pleurochrysis_carterae.AAC.1
MAQRRRAQWKTPVQQRRECRKMAQRRRAQWKMPVQQRRECRKMAQRRIEVGEQGVSVDLGHGVLLWFGPKFDAHSILDARDVDEGASFFFDCHKLRIIAL